MKISERRRVILCLLIFAVVFVALTVGSYVRESATVDEPANLTAGYAKLRLDDYHIDTAHPPLLRIWAALPLLAMPDVRIDTNSPSWSTAEAWEFSHHFLYELNDADRLLYRARFMMSLIGILLGVLVFSWARELFGFWTAATILALYCVEPNILAHSGLVTTDLGVACFSFGALYFLWRMTRRLTWGNVVGTAAFFALAQASKISALILGPIVLILLGVHSLRKDPWPCRFVEAGEFRSRQSKALASFAVMVVLALTSFAVVWTVYGFRPELISRNSALLLLRESAKLPQAVPKVARVAAWLDKHKLVPDAYAQCIIRDQTTMQYHSAYLAGRTSHTGWWYYFPAAFLIKTPLTILVLLFCGVVALMQKYARWRLDAVFLVLPPAVFLGTAMVAHLNIGLRHILPIYPSVLLIAGITLDEIRIKWRSVVLIVPVALASVELATAYPHCLAFFNRIVGGPENGHWYLLDSNIDWGQDLKPLKKWMDAHHVDEINLSYFGTADPAYYGIRWARLPGMLVNYNPTVHGLHLPGYVAVSAQNLHAAHRDAPAPDFYIPLLKRKPSAVIGYSIYVYWVETNWWYTSHP